MRSRLRRSIVASSIVCVGALSMGCGKPSDPSGPPQIHFPSVSQDLGEIPIAPEGRDLEFSFVNRGLSPLHITDLVASCGCVDAAARPAIVPPGAVGTIAVRIAPAESQEKRTSLAVHSDDALNPIVRLSLSWRAVAPLDTDPVLLDFGAVRPGVPVERMVKLKRHAATVREMPCSVTAVDCHPEPILRAVLDDDDGDPAGVETSAAQSLRVTLTPGNESGYQRGTIQLNVDKCWRPGVSVSVQWRVRDVVEASPKSLFLGTGTAGESGSRKVVLSAMAGTTLDVERIELRQADASVRLDLARHGERTFFAEVEWTFPEFPGVYRNELLVHCTKPETRILVVPLSMVVLAATPPGVVE